MDHKNNTFEDYIKFDNILQKLELIDISLFISKLEDSKYFFENGVLFLDNLFYNKNFNELTIKDQLNLLELLNNYNARYSDNVYVEALWYPQEIQNFVKENLPRKYSKRHI